MDFQSKTSFIVVIIFFFMNAFKNKNIFFLITLLISFSLFEEGLIFYTNHFRFVGATTHKVSIFINLSPLSLTP